MKAARIHRFGPPDVIVIDDLPCPTPGAGEVRVRLANAGVGPWDALIREGKSVVKSPLPLTLGSDFSGTVEATGPDVTAFQQRNEVYGVTNPEFIEAYAQFALARANASAFRFEEHPRHLFLSRSDYRTTGQNKGLVQPGQADPASRHRTSLGTGAHCP
jgi:NADPH:quinone reductase-like Zn-dependent oxidoreductase